MKIAKKFQDFDARAVVMVNYISQHWQRLRIAELQKDEMVQHYNNWTAFWYTYIDPNLRTPTTIHQLTTAYNNLEPLLRAFRLQVKNDRSFEKTQEDREGVFLDKPW